MTNAPKQLEKAVDGKQLPLLKTLLKSFKKRDLENIQFTKQTRSFGSNVKEGIDIYSNGVVDEIRPNILHLATVRGYTSMVRAILDYHPLMIDSKTNDNGKFSPLQLAIFARHEKTVRYLIEKGASLRGALVAAVIVKNDSLARDLLAKGADPNDSNPFFKTTPLFYVYNPDLGRTLIQRGATVDRKDIFNWTPLMYQVNSWDPALPQNILNKRHQIVNLLLANNASLSIKGRNRQYRERERGITLLHIAASKVAAGEVSGTLRVDAVMFDLVLRKYTDARMNLNPKTSLGNTPVLYYFECLGTLEGSDFYYAAPDIMDELRYFESKGLNLAMKNKANCSVYDLMARMLRKMIDSNVRNQVQAFLQFRSTMAAEKMKNLHIPSNLNTTDPVLLNRVNVKNAYILKTDLVNKNVTTNGKTKRVRELRTVYNKSSLNGMIQSGRSLVSPMTRRPFVMADIVKLTDVAPASQLKKYKNNSNKKRYT